MMLVLSRSRKAFVLSANTASCRSSALTISPTLKLIVDNLKNCNTLNFEVVNFEFMNFEIASFESVDFEIGGFEIVIFEVVSCKIVSIQFLSFNTVSFVLSACYCQLAIVSLKL